MELYFFSKHATAGELTSFGGDVPRFSFTDSSSAGSANFDVTSDGIFQALHRFLG